MARKIEGEPTNVDDALYLYDRGKLKLGRRFKTRDELLVALEAEYGDGADQGDPGDEDGAGDDVESYDALSVKELQAEIDARNADRDEDDKIQPAGTKKAELIEALEEDDESEEF